MERADVRSFVDNHLSLVISVIVFGLFALKLLSISRGSMATAQAILSEASVFNVMFGIIILYVPFTALFLPLIIWVYVPVTIRPETVYVITAVVATIVPLWVLCMGLFFYVIVSGINRHFSKRWEWGLHIFQPRWALWIVVLLPLLVNLTSRDSTWIPTEQLTSPNVSEIGYVLSDDGGSIVLLRESDRKVIRFAADGVERYYCQNDGWFLEQSLYSLIRLRPEAPDYPECRDDEAPVEPPSTPVASPTSSP